MGFEEMVVEVGVVDNDKSLVVVVVVVVWSVDEKDAVEEHKLNVTFLHCNLMGMGVAALRVADSYSYAVM